MSKIKLKINNENNIISISKTLCNFLGYNKKDIENFPVSIILNEKDIVLRGKHLKDLLSKTSLKDFKISFISKDREKKDYYFSGIVKREYFCPNYGKPTYRCNFFKSAGIHCEKIISFNGKLKLME